RVLCCWPHGLAQQRNRVHANQVMDRTATIFQQSEHPISLCALGHMLRRYAGSEEVCPGQMSKMGWLMLQHCDREGQHGLEFRADGEVFDSRDAAAQFRSQSDSGQMLAESSMPESDRIAGAGHQARFRERHNRLVY